MKLTALIDLLDRGRRRYHLAGTAENGTLIALDVEGRLFSYLDGEVLSLVNEKAFLGISNRDGYLNPGGDGLWPAPEGSRLGYEYSTGTWRVPPSLTNARWQLLEHSDNSFLAAAEIDLINSEGRGIPCLFSRQISLELESGKITQQVLESIRYLGRDNLSREQALIVPWTLCQFNCDEQCQLNLPPCPASEIWDLYTPESSGHRQQSDDGWRVAMKTDFRFQLGLSEKVGSLEFHNPGRRFKAWRCAAPLATGFDYIDIADQDPANEPKGRPVCLSAYCDPSGFMEIEAAGGAPQLLTPNCASELQVTTIFSRC